MAIKTFDVMSLSKAGLINPEQLGCQDSIDIIKDESLKIQKSFVKIGWYLKHIRDNELYKELGYNSVWECATDQLGYSQSTSSRFINICEKFSKDHNSPELDIKYADFDKSQMIEMLPMEQEQLEQVTPDMTVKEIRAIKEKKKETQQIEEAADDNISGQTNIEDDFPEYLPEEKQTEQEADKEEIIDGEFREIREPEKVATSQSDQDGKREQEENLSPYGLPKSEYPEGSLIAIEGCGNKHNCYSCAMKCEIREKERYCVEAPLESPFSCNTMSVVKLLEDEIGDKCQFVNQDIAYHRAGDHEAVPCCKECNVSDCGYRCVRAPYAVSPKEEVQKSEEPSDEIPLENDISVVRHILEQEKKSLDDMLKVNKVEKLPEMMVLRQKIIVGALAAMVYDLESADTEETSDMLQPSEVENPHDEKWFVRQYIKIYPNEASKLFKICQTEQSNSDRAKAIQKHIAPYGYSGHSCSEYDFTFHSFTAGMDFRIGDETMHLKYGRFAVELMEMLDEKGSVQPELPVLKNNDQRKKWLGNYKEWGLWYKDENIDVNYYKYDFLDGSRLVVAEIQKKA